MIYYVITSRLAIRDSNVIADHIRSYSPSGAIARLNAYRSAVEKLTVNPGGYPLADEYEQFDIELREASFKTRRGKCYRLVFTIAGNEVRILRVRGPGQSAVDPSDI